MKRTAAAIISAILLTLLVSDKAVYSRVTKKTSIISEIRNSPEKSDIFFYCKVSALLNFYNKNGIPTEDVLFLLETDSKSKSRESVLLKNVLKHIDEIAVIGQSEAIQKSSGILVICKLKGPVKALTVMMKKFKSEKVDGVKIYLYDKGKNLYFLRKNNTYIIGFRPFLLSYMKLRNSKKKKLSAAQKNVLKYSVGKTIYLHVSVSKMMKEKMKMAMKKGASFGKGLSVNVFINSIINMQSLEAALVMADKIKFFLGMEAGTVTDGKRLLMVSHFMIVASSLAVSFADQFARSFGKKGLSTSSKNVEKIQAVFGRINSKATRKGVQLDYQFNEKEKSEFILSLKNTIKTKREDRKRMEAESRLVELFAAIKSGNEAAVTNLLKKYSIVNTQNQKKETPLFHAVRNGKHKIIKLLLNKGADVNGKITAALLTPLMVAARSNDVEAIKILLEGGAKIDAVDKSGNTAFHFALKYTVLKSAQYLLEKGANINTVTVRGESTLYNSVKAGFTDITKAIINKGANVNTRSANGITPLHMASMKGKTTIIKLLLEKGADKNSKTKRGMTPLHYAAEHGHLEAVKVLVKAGADTTVKDKDGNTPANKARHNGNYNVSEYLDGKIKK